MKLMTDLSNKIEIDASYKNANMTYVWSKLMSKIIYGVFQGCKNHAGRTPWMLK